MEKIIVVTGNNHKWKEIFSILNKKTNIKISRKILNLTEIQGTEDEIIKSKAIEAYKKIKKPCIVEDVSLGFKEWNYLPGPYIKHFANIIGVENYYKLLKNKTAKVTCTIALIKSEKDITIVKGHVYGTIVKQRKDNGFDFDKIFQPKGFKETYSEMDIEIKNKISHRGKALKKLVNYLNR
jgi:inosine triphosphate pyrophosphatase